MPSVNTLGLLLAGGLSRRMGGGDKALAAARRADPARPCHRPYRAAGRRARPQRERRSRPLRGFRAAGRRRQRSRFRRPARRNSRRARLGRRASAGLPRYRQRADRRAVPAARSGRAPACGNARRPAPTSPAPRRAARPHPVVGLWPVRLRDSLREAVVAEGIRKVDVWTARYRLRMVDFPEERPGLDPFFNANRPGDLDRAAELLGRPNRPGSRRGKESRMARTGRICEHLRH